MESKVKGLRKLIRSTEEEDVEAMGRLLVSVVVGDCSSKGVNPIRIHEVLKTRDNEGLKATRLKAMIAFIGSHPNFI